MGRKGVHPINFLDLTGQRFGRWTVQSIASSDGNRVRWNCLCDCGGTKTVTTGKLRNGESSSCGCFRRENSRDMALRHGHARPGQVTKVFRAWQLIRGRCSDPTNNRFFLYGARGIKVCERWLVFENFLADMGEPPSAQHSIDRLDGNGDYEPRNCRWATPAEQGRNKRNNLRIEWNGEIRCSSEWCEQFGWPRRVIDDRLRKGWTIERTMSQPVRKYEPNRS